MIAVSKELVRASEVLVLPSPWLISGLASVRQSLDCPTGRLYMPFDEWMWAIVF